LNRDQIFKIQANGFNHTANVALNDFQMWHLDNAITFTPLRNLDIATECLYAEPDVVLHQVIHGGLSKAIIEKLNPKNLESISLYKNNYTT
jgi:DNA-binding MltR family transcriptional regulator